MVDAKILKEFTPSQGEVITKKTTLIKLVASYHKKKSCKKYSETLKQKLSQKNLAWMKELSNTIRINLLLHLNDHEKNFQNNPKCRLINPAKTEIGTVSKHYSDRVNKSIRETLNVNEWRNAQVVITWFKNTKSKHSSSFIKQRKS